MLLYNYIDGNAEFGFRSVNTFLENKFLLLYRVLDTSDFLLVTWWKVI